MRRCVDRWRLLIVADLRPQQDRSDILQQDRSDILESRKNKTGNVRIT
jgi:hypothetical protein